MFISIFWLVFVIMAICGFGLGIFVISKTEGFFDFRPLIGVGIWLIAFVILVMMILGRYLF